MNLRGIFPGWRIFQCLAGVLIGLAVFGAEAQEIQATVQPAEVWGDGNYYSGYPSSGTLLAAQNAVQQTMLSNCLAFHATLPPHSYQCSVLFITGITPNLSMPQMENGDYQYFWDIAHWHNEGVYNGPFSNDQDANNYRQAIRNVVCPKYQNLSTKAVVTGPNSQQISCVRYSLPPMQCLPKDSGKSAGSGAPGGMGNPIQIYSGTKTESQSDYVDVRGLLSVERQFVGQSNAWRMPGDPVLVDTYSNPISLQVISESYPGMTIDPISGGVISWISELQFSYIPTNSTGELYILNSDGSYAKYVPSSTGSFATDVSGDALSYLATPTPEGSIWRVQRAANVIEEYGPDGRLRRRQFSSGAYVIYQYTSGLLTAMTDNWGHQLALTPGANGQPAIVTLPDGAKLTYAFQGPLLNTVTYGDGTSRQFLYNEPAYAASAGTPAPFELTGAIDELGVRVGSYHYDSSGTAISTERAGGVDKYSLTIGAGAYSSVIYSSVTDPLGSQRTVVFTSVNGNGAVASQTQPAGSGCAASSSAFAYDANGNVASKDDFNGNRICYGNDLIRNLELTRIEGLSNSANCSTYAATNATLPAGSRKVSTQWHPDWRLETQRAEPLKLTASIYNGQPDPFNGGAMASCAPATALLPNGKPIAVLCKQVEQATTDADGHLGFSATLQSGLANRVRQWTYNQYGQVLTAKGPRTDVNDTTTFSYYATTAANYTMGDLSSVVNAAGQATQFPLYNKHGQVLRMVDANGIITDNTYDLRQRLTSTTTGGLQTVYTYDLAGQLIQLTLPDTTRISYTYDPAHRLTQVTDQAGNSITYTLDNAGNRTQDQVKDPQGNLARTITRAFDALGRVQQLTGASN